MAATKISALSALTGASVDPAADVGVIVDTSTTTTKKIVVQEFFNILNTLTADATPDNAADYMLTFDASASAAKKVLLNLVGASYKVGNTTRDMTAATASVAYTGVGFKPKSVLFLCCVSSTNAVSIGFSDGTLQGAIGNNQPTTDNTWVAVTSLVAYLSPASSVQQQASLATLDADGFTLDWTKVGLPTGTASIFYLAMR